MKTYLWLSLIASVLYGIANPLMGIGQRLGLTTSSTIFSSSLGGLIIGIVYWWNHRDVPLPSLQACSVGVMVGAIWTIAMLLWTRALAPDMQSTASTIFLIVGTNPFIAVLISATIFKEWDKVVLWKFCAGGGLIAAGLYLITTCKKVSAS
ncbi:MAG: hypothetical protein AAB391_00260 [Patescibacteria group bacterium]